MIRRKHTPAARRRGLSLVEIVVATAIAGVLFGVVAEVQVQSTKHSQSILARDFADTRGRRTLERVAGELRGVGVNFLVPDPTGDLGASTLLFQKPADVTDDGVVVWDAPTRIVFELEPNEDDNGSDDDGDGAIDEHRLVLVREIGTADERAVVVCGGLAEFAAGEVANGLDDNGDGRADEPGFFVRRVGDLLTVRLTTLAPVSGGPPLATNLQTSVVLRN